MGFYVFDFDGTIADLDHRRSLLPNWDAFFEACDKDGVIEPVVAVMDILVGAGHRVEIWSGRSASVEEKSRVWLGHRQHLLKRMRPIDNVEPDDKLKRDWLREEQAAGTPPDAIFDDRQKVVDMWRAEGVQCFQVNPGDFDEPKTAIRPLDIYTKTKAALVTLLIGPSGAGKTALIDTCFDEQSVISTDRLRLNLTGDEGDQSRNLDVFRALHTLVKARVHCGLPVVVDATNIKTKERVTLAKMTPAGTRCAYIIVNRPMEEKQANAGRRDGVLVKGVPLLEAHERTFQANLKAIRNGDGLPHVDVYEDVDTYFDVLALAHEEWNIISAESAVNDDANHRTDAA